MKNKVIKIVFNDGTSQKMVDLVVAALTCIWTLANITAIQIVGEEDCQEDAETGEGRMPCARTGDGDAMRPNGEGDAMRSNGEGGCHA